MNIPIIAYVSASSHIAPAAAGWWYWRRLSLPRRVLVLYFNFTVLIEIIELTLALSGIPNVFVINIHRLGEFVSFMYFFRHYVHHPTYREALMILSMLYIVLWFTEVSFDPFPKQYTEFINGVSNIALLMVSVAVSFYLFNTSHGNLTSQSVFWICLGAILAFSSTVMIYSLGNTILAMGVEQFTLLWHFNWGFNIVANILFTRSFLCQQ
ncbi:MAG: hypothetical protein AB1600_03670 [Bacteroidota bacterium]